MWQRGNCIEEPVYQLFLYFLFWTRMFVIKSLLTGKCAKYKNLTSLWTCWHILDILRSQNKIKMLIFTWLCCFKNRKPWAQKVLISDHTSAMIAASLNLFQSLAKVRTREHTSVPFNTTHWTYALLMLGHRLRRWANIKTALVPCMVLILVMQQTRDVQPMPS